MISLLVNESTLEKSKSGSITGEIFFELEDSFFPEFQWNDFVVVILEWWNKSIRLLESSSVGTSVEFNFMDGPYLVYGVKKNAQNVSLRFVRRNKASTEILSTLDIEIGVLKRAISKSTNRIIRAIKIKNWITDDIEQLEKFLE